MPSLQKVAVWVLGATLAAGPAFAQESKKPAEKPPMDEKAAMELMQKLATPGAGHKKLDPFVGAWTARMSMWMDPTKDPVSSEGTTEFKWILGGRYLQQTYEGQFMGGPFSGVGYTGYDNYKKRYVATWMDSASTSILNMSGSFDKTGKTLTMTGRIDDFTTGKTATVRSKGWMVGNDELRWEMYGPAPDGKEYKMMEIVYTRKK
jgi:hypothetical protein